MRPPRIVEFQDWMRESIAALHDKSAIDFPLPDLNNNLYISKKVACYDGDIAACGLVRLTAEGILIIDQSLPTTARVNIINSLIASMTDDIYAKGLDECHVFTLNSKVKGILRKSGFIECKGDPLVLQFGGNNG